MNNQRNKILARRKTDAVPRSKPNRTRRSVNTRSRRPRDDDGDYSLLDNWLNNSISESHKVPLDKET